MLLGPVLMTPTPPCPSLDNVNSVFVPQQLSSLPSLHMPPAKRPKLSLQTTQLSTNYGTSSSNTGARMETMSTTTPTTLNTLSNTFDLTIRTSPISSTSSPAPFQLSKSACSSPYARRRPYDLNLPFGKRPILKNSSLHQQYRLSTLTTSASPRHGGRRSFFPAPKKVSFQAVEEEIVTQTYVARHVDLSESSSDEDYQSADETSETAIVPIDDVLTVNQANDSNITQSPGIGRAGMKRGRSVGGRSASATRSKRKRRWWEWTLAELERAEAETMATVKAEEVIADAEAEVQLQMETEDAKAEDGVVETKVEDGVVEAKAEDRVMEAKVEDEAVEAESANSKTIDVVAQSNEEEKQPGCYEALDDGLGHDSDWDTISSSTLSTPQMEQTKLFEKWDDSTICDDI